MQTVVYTLGIIGVHHVYNVAYSLWTPGRSVVIWCFRADILIVKLETSKHQPDKELAVNDLKAEIDNFIFSFQVLWKKVFNLNFFSKALISVITMTSSFFSLGLMLSCIRAGNKTISFFLMIAATSVCHVFSNEIIQYVKRTVLATKPILLDASERKHIVVSSNITQDSDQRPGKQFVQ